jgi:dihydrofolate reductase
MRKLFLHMFLSVDGYFEGPEKDLGWSQRVALDEDYQTYSNQLLCSVDAMLIGRKVYDLFASYWPEAEKINQHPAQLEAARLLNEMPKYVVSKKLKVAEWQNSHIIRNDIIKSIKKLKRQAGKDIVVFGGAELVNSLLAHQLIDEYRLVIHPVILGNGRKLFNSPMKEKLKLVDEKRFKSGAILLSFKTIK